MSMWSSNLSSLHILSVNRLGCMWIFLHSPSCIVCVDTALLLYFITASFFIKVLHGIILIQTNNCAYIYKFEGAMHADIHIYNSLSHCHRSTAYTLYIYAHIKALLATPIMIPPHYLTFIGLSADM